MVNEIITIFCTCDDFLKIIGYKDNVQARMTTAEIITTTIVAAKYFGGNYAKSRIFMLFHGYIPKMLSESRFIRRLNEIGTELLENIFSLLAQMFKNANVGNEYAIDSFPIEVCANVRMERCKIIDSKEYLGFCASKQQYFFGIKVHMLVTKSGLPVEFMITPGSVSDIKAARLFALDIPLKSKIHADKGYTDYAFEDYLSLQRQIELCVKRKSNSKRKEKKVCGKTRKVVETAFSLITRNFPRKIHAVTAQGFQVKIYMFIFAYIIGFLVAT